MPFAPLVLLPLLATAVTSPRGEDDPFAAARWIWGGATAELERPNGEACRLTKEFALASAPAKATAWVTCDNHFRLLVNGKLAGHGDEWTRPAAIDVASLLHAGSNRVDALCWNDGSAAGLLFAARVTLPDASSTTIVSDASWLAAPCPLDVARTAAAAPADLPSSPAHEAGAYGCSPWGKFAVQKPDDRFEPLPGFHVECVADSVGSVINLGLDDRERLYVAAEGRGIVRLSLPMYKGDQVAGAPEAETFTELVTSCQGFLWDGDGLFAVGDGPQGAALYRIPEATRIPECLGRFEGGMGEHGPHALVRGADGWIYMAIGNHASLVEPIGPDSPLSPLRYEGHLLPRYVDPRGHATHCRAPGGVVARFDPKTRAWELYAGGFRNHFDLTFDTSGHLFTFDSDMEWDVGLPWYRAVRLVHVVPGGEYGWRTGSSTWPMWFADSLPPALETGRGSPTGMCCYDKTQFPARFRGAILAGDWSQGQILAFHPKAEGATFTAEQEVLLRGRPLNVTDLVVASDGSLLFSVGGRGTAGGVYRLTYAEPKGAASANANAKTAAIPMAKPLTSATPSFTAATPTRDLLAALGDPDRWVRYLAGRALERRDPATFEIEALALPSPLARAEALVALARIGLTRSDEAAWQRELAAAGAIVAATSAAPSAPKDAAPTTSAAPRASSTNPPLVSANAVDPSLVTALRALELLFLNHDGVAIAARPADFARVAASLSPILLKRFPTGSPDADRELAQLLAFLGDPAATPKLYDAFVKEPSRVEQIWLVYCLRCCKEGFTPEMRVALAKWLDHAIADWSGGASFEGYLRYLRGDVDRLLTEGERAELAAAAAAAAHQICGGVISATDQEPRDLDQVTTFVERTRDAARRSLPEGARLFQKSCASCHQIAGRGKSVGPELTTAAGRFRVRDLLEAILVPSKTISDQYRATNFFLKGGDIVSGIPTLDDGKRVIVVESTGLPRELASDAIESRRVAVKSLMPEGLLDGMTLEEIGDLVGFVLAGQAIEPPPESAPPLWKTIEVTEATGAGDSTTAAPPSPSRPATAPLTDAPASDFMLEYEIRLADPTTSCGLSFRASKAADGSLHGYRCVAGAEMWGALVDDGGRGTIQKPKFEIWHTLADLHGWNHFVVTAVGDRITIEHNGVVTIDLTDPGGARSGLVEFMRPKFPADSPFAAVDGFVVRNVRLRVMEAATRR
jgi:putative heme-binding domain-containing protein